MQAMVIMFTSVVASLDDLEGPICLGEEVHLWSSHTTETGCSTSFLEAQLSVTFLFKKHWGLVLGEMGPLWTPNTTETDFWIRG